MNLRWKIAQAFEIRWWQRYLRNKSNVDYLDWKRNYWEKFLDRIGVTPVENTQVLDVGCGPAGVFIVLPNQNVDAVDPLLSEYEEKLPHFNSLAYPWVKFHQLPFEKFNLSSTYHYIFCLNAINHVDDLDHCFDKLVAACKPGGTLIVSIDAHNHGFFKSLFRLVPGDILHPHQYDLKEYQSMLTNRGCRLDKSILYKKEFFFDYYVLVAQKPASAMETSDN